MLNDTGALKKKASQWKPEETVRGVFIRGRMKSGVMEKGIGPEGLGGKGSKRGNVASPMFSDSSPLPLASEIRMLLCSGYRRGTFYMWVL